MATNGLVVMTPSSIAYSGTSASINADGSVDFSAVTSLSLNGVFTGDYDNYMIAIRNTANTTDNLCYRLRASGTDTATSTYTRQFIYVNGTSVTGLRSTLTQAFINAPFNTQRIGTTVYLFGPFLTQPTAVRSVTVLDQSSAGIYDNASTQSGSTSFDGITFRLEGGTGTITGLLTVFGFNQ